MSHQIHPYRFRRKAILGGATVLAMLTATAALAVAQVSGGPDGTPPGDPPDPNGAGFQAMDSEDGTASAHAFEWVKRLGEGAHIIRIEQRVGNAATTFYKDDWTFDVSVYL